MKKFLLSAVVLSSMGAYAQVGINTTEPEAMLDVNGDLRLQSVEKVTMGAGSADLFPDCTPCVMLIDAKGVVKRKPLSEFFEGNTSGGTQPATNYSATEQFTASDNFTKQGCPSGQTPEPYTVRMTAEVTLYSTVSEEKASEEALAKATQIANTWVADHGQAEANAHGKCVATQPTVYTATAGPKKETRSVQKNNCSSGLAGTFVEVESPEFTGHGESRKSESHAQSLADADLKHQLDEWFNGTGQAKANNEGKCDITSEWSTVRVCDGSSGQYLKDVVRDGEWTVDTKTQQVYGYTTAIQGQKRLKCSAYLEGEYLDYRSRGITWRCGYGKYGYLWVISMLDVSYEGNEGYRNNGKMCRH